MKWLARLLSKTQSDNPVHQNDDLDCDTSELNDFIQKFVTEESLEPAIQAFTKHNCGCGCGCDEGANIEIPLTENHSENTNNLTLQLEGFLAGHMAFLHELEMMMRQNKTSEFNLYAINDGFMCSIGQWLKCENGSMKRYPEYMILLENYECFRQCAATMLDFHRRGQFAKAVYIWRNDLEVQSALVQKSLLNLVAAILDNNLTSK